MPSSGLLCALLLLWSAPPLAQGFRVMPAPTTHGDPTATPQTTLLPTSMLMTRTTPTTTPMTSGPQRPTTPPAPIRDMTYWLSFSKLMAPGGVVKVKVYAPNATAAFTLHLELMLYTGVVVGTSQSFTLQRSDSVQEVEMKVSKDIRRWTSYYLRARATGGLTFQGFERMETTNKRLSVFVQTDKAVYKPGETIRFRCLVMHPDLTVAEEEPMDIIIKDPQNNMMARWDAVKGEHLGVFQGHLPTSLYPPLGQWTIQVTVDEEKQEKKFDMKEYELPKFEVNVNVPSYVLISDNYFTAKISAKYVFGLPLRNGTGEIEATISNYFRNTSPVKRKFKLDQNGEAVVNFTVTELEAQVQTVYSWYRIYYFTRVSLAANVTDSATGDLGSGKASVNFYRSGEKLSFGKQTPSSFKPGLPYTVYIEALQPDDTPLQNAENRTVTVEASEYSPWYSWYSRYTLLVNTTLTLDAQGRATYTLPSIPASSRTLKLMASLNSNVRAYKYAYRFYSNANVYLQIKFKTSNPKIGERMQVNLKSNAVFGDYAYQIFSKGHLVECKRIKRSSGTKTTSFTFRILPSMAPFLDVLVFFETTGGEVVVDKQALILEDFTDNEISMEFKDKEVKPGAQTELKVKAAFGTSVFMLGVDKSVKLLGTGNDITKSNVLTELFKHGGFSLYSLCCYYAINAEYVFRAAKAGIITDGFVLGKNLNDVPIPFRMVITTVPYKTHAPTAQMRATRVATTNVPTRVAFARAPPPTQAALKIDSAPKPQTPAERLRKFFPETWLWMILNINDCASTSVNLTAPDTITTWEVTAFGVHRQKGLTVASKPATLLTIKRLFIILDLPYSAVRGEDVCFKALTFNNYPISVNVDITLHKNCSAFKSVFVKPAPYNPKDVIEVRQSLTVTKKLGMLAPGAMVVTTFCITPKSLGDMPVQVTLQATRPGDGLVRTIRIKPEGVERCQSYPLLIELNSTGMFSDTVYPTLPDNYVQGSLRLVVQVVGDVLGGVVDNLADLLGMPYGCGEQQLIRLAPNTYIIAYLRNTGRLTPEVLETAKTFMVAGYQGELRYQRYDGSFSAFGNSDKSGSMWLTAFVVKCFVQAAGLGSDIITVEPKVVIRALWFIIRYQNTNGSFAEPGRVIHTAMQGGSSHGLGLTAYVTIALKEALNSVSDKMSSYEKLLVTGSLNKAVAYLENQLPSSGWVKNDSYIACIVTYALTLTNSSKAQNAMTMMNKLAVFEGLSKHWEGPAPPKKTRYPWYRNTYPVNVEMTSYALLAMGKVQPVAEGIPVVRWLHKQRNDRGAFLSTQDTVLGLEALTSMADLALSDDFSPINVRIKWVSGRPRSAALFINNDNVMLMQKVHLPLNGKHYPRQVTIEATSKVPAGERMFALAEVAACYNVETPTAKDVFTVRSSIVNSTSSSFGLQVCVSRVAGSTSARNSMIVMQVYLPSGHEVKKEQSTFGSSSRQDFEKDQVVLYYYELSTEEDCAFFTMAMTRAVAHLKSQAIIVYDYYNQNNEVTASYQPPDYGSCEVGLEDSLCSKA